MTIINIGCSFFMDSPSIARNITAEHRNAGLVNTPALTPAGKNTVCPVVTTAAAISPTTAGFSPDIQPLTARLSRNLS